MKVCLVVTQGPHNGKEVPINLAQFLIGRDPQCHLRPASPMISRRHCAVIVREGKVYLRDFGSTNGTQVNDQRVTGEVELHNEDRLRLDPLVFVVKIEKTVPLDKATPVPPTKGRAGPVDDDEAAADMLLNLPEESGGGLSLPDMNAEASDIPSGTTVFDMPAPKNAQDQKQEENKAKETSKDSGNTSVAAKAILDKYSRRKRG
jgi:pSer/pThr/pTyr-binding forkhead associated (FHA) protein